MSVKRLATRTDRRGSSSAVARAAASRHETASRCAAHAERLARPHASRVLLRVLLAVIVAVLIAVAALAFYFALDDAPEHLARASWARQLASTLFTVLSGLLVTGLPLLLGSAATGGKSTPH